MTYQPSYCAYMIKVPLEHIKPTGCKKIDMHRKLWQMMANHGTYSRSWNSIVSKWFKQYQTRINGGVPLKKWGGHLSPKSSQIRPFEYWNQWRLGIRSSWCRLLRFHPRTGGGSSSVINNRGGIRNGDCMACWDFNSKLGLSLSYQELSMSKSKPWISICLFCNIT